jgi:hypothetical protein
MKLAAMGAIDRYAQQQSLSIRYANRDLCLRLLIRDSIVELQPAIPPGPLPYRSASGDGSHCSHFLKILGAARLQESNGFLRWPAHVRRMRRVQ